MEHAPIYRSTTRRKSTSTIPWRRTAAFASAAAALTVGGIALGYGGFSTTTDAPPALDTTAAGRSVSAPVPVIALAVVDGGHPDVISSLSSALITQFQIAQGPITALGPLVKPILAPPTATAEPFVLPEILIPPSADPTEPTARAPEADTSAPIAEDVPSNDLSVGPLLTPRARPQTQTLVAPPPDTAPIAEAPPDPQDQVVAVVRPEPDPTPQPPVRITAPVRVATPVAHRPTPEPARPERVLRVPRVEIRRIEPAAVKPDSNNSGPGNAQARTSPGHPEDPKANDKSGKGKDSGK